MILICQIMDGFSKFTKLSHYMVICSNPYNHKWYKRSTVWEKLDVKKFLSLVGHNKN